MSVYNFAPIDVDSVCLFARKVKVNSIRSRLFNFISINMENKLKCFLLSFQLRQLIYTTTAHVLAEMIFHEIKSIISKFLNKSLFMYERMA